MNQAELNRAVARVTGESINTIKRLGFMLDEPSCEQELVNEDLDAQVIDWDQLDLQRAIHNDRRIERELVHV